MPQEALLEDSLAVCLLQEGVAPEGLVFPLVELDRVLAHQSPGLCVLEVFKLRGLNSYLAALVLGYSVLVFVEELATVVLLALGFVIQGDENIFILKNGVHAGVFRVEVRAMQEGLERRTDVLLKHLLPVYVSAPRVFLDFSGSSLSADSLLWVFLEQTGQEIRALRREEAGETQGVL